MIITISGTPGAGKDTVGKILSEKLKYKLYSIGEMRREMAKQRGITLEELNLIGEKEFWTDHEVDEFQEELGQTRDNIVVVSRLGWYFIKNSLKVFLKADLRVAAERILKDFREEEKYIDVDEAYEHLLKRQATDERRYKKYYSIRLDDMHNYDLIIDTTNITAEEAVKIILEAVKIYLEKEEKKE